VILAHDLGPAADLPAPVEYFVVGTALLLVSLFMVLATRKHQPSLESGPDYSRQSTLVVPARSLSVIGLVGLTVVVGQLVRLGADTQVDRTRPTMAPVLVWVFFWLVIPFASVVIGDWYTQINPWRTLGRVLGFGEERRPELVSRLGVWPAVALLIAFGWLQLIAPNPADPITLAAVASAYTLVLLVVMRVVGVDSALASFDFFTPYNRLISSIAPFGRNDGGGVVWRGWLKSLPALPRWRGLWMFVLSMIGVVLYDGLSGTDWFFTARSQAGATLLFVVTIAVLAGVYRVAAPSAHRYAHALVPFAVALAFAHYFTLIVFEGQLIIAALSDPFGLGWNLFGTADWAINYFAIPDAVVWYIQLASIVIGSATGVVLVHDRAVADFGAGSIRAQYAMLALMIGLTTVGLLVLAG
jgi:hypothetical protein